MHTVLAVSFLLIACLNQVQAYEDPYGSGIIPNCTTDPCQPLCADLYYDNYSIANDPNGPIGDSWCDSLTLLCFSKILHKTAVAFAVTSVVCSLLLIIFMIIDKPGRETRQGYNNQMLIILICLGDIMYEVAHGVDHILYWKTDNTWGDTHYAACVAGGFFSFFGILFSACIALLVALNLAASLFVSAAGKKMFFVPWWAFGLTAGFVSFMITMIPAAAGKYGNAGFWCGPAAAIPSSLLFGFSIPILVFIFLIFITYFGIAAFMIYFFCSLGKGGGGGGDDTFKYQTIASVTKMIFYPVVFAFVWLPICIYLLHVYAGNPLRVWAFLAVLFANQIGLWNFISYFVSAQLSKRYVNYKVAKSQAKSAAQSGRAKSSSSTKHSANSSVS